MTKPLHAGAERYTALFDDRLCDDIDAFRRAQLIPPSRSETLRTLVRAGLEALRQGVATQARDCTKAVGCDAPF